MRRPTILFINRVYPPVRGATGRMLYDLVRGFARQGWHVTVLTSAPDASDTFEDGVRVVRVKGSAKPSGMAGYMCVWARLFWAALWLKRRQIVVSMTDPPMLVVAGAVVALLKRSHHINWCQDLYPEVMPALGIFVSEKKMRFFVSLRRWAMGRCSKVIVNGRCMARYLVQDGGVDVRKVTFIPNWPDRELLDPESASGGEVCPVIEDIASVRPFEKQLKAKKRFRILYAGNIGLAHPVDLVLDAAKVLEKEGSDIEFVFIGEGVRFDELAKRRAEYGLDNIRLMPFQPLSRLREVMKSGDVHLISMKEEAAGFLVPSKLYSSLAVARPCLFIGPEHCECAKVIRDFGAGIVVPQGDSEMFLNAVKSLRGSEEAWLGAHNGALRARETYTPRNSINAWIERAAGLVR